MSAEFVTIKEAVDAYKGNFIATVIKQSELKSGTKNGRDWTRRIFTVQDATGEVELTCFGDEIQFFKVGGKYEIFPWWKEKYEGKTNLGIGKYGKAHLIGTDDIGNKQTTMPESKPETRGEINGKPLPKFSQPEYVKQETILLLQIEEAVKSTMQPYMPKIQEPNNQKIGMFVKIIYEEYKRMGRDRA